MPEDLSYRFSIAPMMDWTDRHCRTFHRMLSRQALLYTEMVTTGAILYGDAERHLAFDPGEHPVALQLGGSDPAALAESAAAGTHYGYDEINLNIGCPSDRVQNGRFGACLMAEPDLVARCVAAMKAATTLPVTVKTRIGVDDRDSYEELCDFIARVADGGCETFIIHARKAWLKGLSPKENREIPPLSYETAYRLKADFPELTIVLNGGVENLDQAERHLDQVDGVMMGRAAYKDPWLLADVDRRLFAQTSPLPSRTEVARQLADYLHRQQQEGVPPRAITRHILGLFNGQPGARRWRQVLSDARRLEEAGPDIVNEALDAMTSSSRSPAFDRAEAATA
ncbi:tRNA dihydrouridine(20/20a) synthase DusA [Fodinicurvata sediminis]|uniref:tRNA dihydrouridine(20/20a) synthase DusA n=1 Tax=Fodinicurvata sediminis TaxID=1121832 RepID=UPI0003B46311|nr:tRNA dihydrouridine(20/20a) synthase DusA [Fodinicurvata sediminis]